MKLLPLLFVCLCALLTACSVKDSTPEVSDGHGEAIWEFQAAQMLFKHTVGTIRDESSFDRATQRLNLVVEKFHNVAGLMKKLTPPEGGAVGNFRRKIVEGHRKSEPTEQDMQTLLSLKGREKEVVAWMERFAAAGQEVGTEIKRLYGDLDYGAPEAPLPPLPTSPAPVTPVTPTAPVAPVVH